MRAGELIFDTDPEYPSLYAEFEKTMKLVAQLNSGYHTPEEIRDLLGRIWGQPLDESVRMFPPFYTNFGKFMGVKTKCTKEEQRQKDRYPVYIRRLAARHPRTHRETKCYFGDTFVLHLNQI